MKRNYFSGWITAVIFLILFTSVVSNQVVNAAPIDSISRMRSGVVASDSLTTGDTSYWAFWSSTINTPLLRNHHEDSQGLHIGVQAPYSGKWVNYAAVSPVTDAFLFHAVVTNPYTSISDGVFETGLYVVSSTNSNYVGCIAVADFSGHYWSVVQAYGSDVIGSGILTTLYKSPLNTMPLTEDCTIITNGDNYLKVYLGGDVVFSSDTMMQSMPTPFRAYLQVDATSPTMHHGTYLDYYATSSEKVIVTDALFGGTVQLVDSFNNTLASSPVASDGTATILVGMYSLPLAANILVYDSNSTLVAATSSPVNIFGGDVYSVVRAPQPPTELTANAISASRINLTWTAPTDDGGLPITGYSIGRSADSGVIWSTIVSNTASTATIYSDTGLLANMTYTYRVSAINSVGSSAPSDTAFATTKPFTTTSLTINTQKLNGDAIEGIYVQLYKDGGVIASGYSPVTFTLNNDELYTVIPNSWLGYSFDHWLDTGSTNNARDISISSDITLTAVYRTLP